MISSQLNTFRVDYEFAVKLFTKSSMQLKPHTSSAALVREDHSSSDESESNDEQTDDDLFDQNRPQQRNPNQFYRF